MFFKCLLTLYFNTGLPEPWQVRRGVARRPASAASREQQQDLRWVHSEAEQEDPGRGARAAVDQVADGEDAGVGGGRGARDQSDRAE